VRGTVAEYEFDDIQIQPLNDESSLEAARVEELKNSRRTLTIIKMVLDHSREGVTDFFNGDSISPEIYGAIFKDPSHYTENNYHTKRLAEIRVRTLDALCLTVFYI